MARLDVPATIRRKRDGHELEADEIRAFFTAYLDGDVAEEQMSAFLMAGVIRGFTPDEAAAMTEVAVASGEVVDLSGLAGPTVDKHSTGGVGDTTTLVVAPILAACGLQVAKLSGRGLGHTGGTLDKLEAIPGFRVSLSPDEVTAQVTDIGLAVAAATADVVPLDKRLYALRDVTATVQSAALIAASVMSKKLAGGASTVLLDVKVGDGAFMTDLDDATELARQCVAIGQAHGRATGALITDMSQPLSHAIGNAVEVAHAVDVLTGERPGRFRDLCLELATAALVLTGRDPDDAAAATADALDSQAAADRFRAMVSAQGGDADIVDDPRAVLPDAPVVGTWQAPDGVLVDVDTRGLGALAGGLGAGRQRKEDDVDPTVGLEFWLEIGDDTTAIEPSVTIHASTGEDLDWARGRLEDLVTVGEGAVPPPLVHDRLLGEDPA
ncbi:thymidine phosphorylase [Salsipaludibacter albus]|uniref:thymidine phosphorylase n=1 Tax=Salsipaludibacter albus TaxID=2849650 RepID=UPI001EE43E4C|nr:thymidine phosphorylase [Salsipaludibacter albus]MBY5164191.1 thymidine phosphorylase [Salsipaludibacter albus]